MPSCFAKVTAPDLTTGTAQGLWDLRDRCHLYAMLLLYGAPVHILRWIDGALLVDLWREMDIPGPVRNSWDPVVQAGVRGPTERW